MWTLTAEDIRQAKADAMKRRHEIEISLAAVDAEIKELEAVEKAANAFLTKYRGDRASDLSDNKSTSPATHAAGPIVARSLKTPVPETRPNNWGNVRLAPTYETGT